MGSLERKSKKGAGGGFRIVVGDKQYPEFHDAASLQPNLKTCKSKRMYIAVRESLYTASWSPLAENMIEIS